MDSLKLPLLMDILLPLLLQVNKKLHWPIWALQAVALLSIAALSLIIIQSFVLYANSKSDNQLQRKASKTAKFRKFQLHYLIVFFVVMLADWLQGTNMYTLYLSYKVNVGALFLTGFLSSAVFGTFLGIYIDKWGRRYGCLLFCVLEVSIFFLVDIVFSINFASYIQIIINSLEHIPHMPT